MKLMTIVVIAFLLVGGMMIVKYNSYKMDNPDDRISFVKDFGKWMFGVGKSVGNVIGAAAEQEWLPSDQNDSSNLTTDEKMIKHD
jgi:hypothetical protein